LSSENNLGGRGRRCMAEEKRGGEEKVSYKEGSAIQGLALL